MAETVQSRCPCARCRVRSFTGPVMLIVVGVIFLCGEYTPYGFATLWPALLVVAGVLMLAQAGTSGEGHIAAPADPGGALRFPESAGPHRTSGTGPETPVSGSS